MRTRKILWCLSLPLLISACDQNSKPAPDTEPPLWEITQHPAPTEQADLLTSPASKTNPSSGDTHVLPLPRILEIVRRDTPGEVLEVDEDDDNDLVTYEVQILTPDDRKIEITVNAHTGAIIERDED